MWEWLLAILTWLSSDPKAIDLAQPRAAAAVAMAYASMAEDAPAPEPSPVPAPKECVCGGTCVNGFWKPDGRIVQPCPCPATCDCKKTTKKPACPDGKCKK